MVQGYGAPWLSPGEGLMADGGGQGSDLTSTQEAVADGALLDVFTALLCSRMWIGP